MRDDKIIINSSEIELDQKNNNIRPFKAVDLENYKSITSEAMINDVPPLQEFIFSPCFPTQGIGWIYASTGLGKTLFALNLAYYDIIYLHIFI